MFGSNFFGNFGIPDFPYQGADPQGGMLGPNAPAVQSPMSQNDAGGSQPIAGQPSPAGPAALGPNSPLSSTTLAPNTPAQPQAGTSDMMQQAPAAGIGSPFRRPSNG